MTMKKSTAIEKLVYVTPSVEVIVLSSAAPLLAVSGVTGDGSGSDLDYGGLGGDGEYGD